MELQLHSLLAWTVNNCEWLPSRPSHLFSDKQLPISTGEFRSRFRFFFQKTEYFASVGNRTSISRMSLRCLVTWLTELHPGRWCVLSVLQHVQLPQCTVRSAQAAVCPYSLAYGRIIQTNKRNIFNFFMSSTCFDPESSSSGRRLYVQVRYSVFHTHQYVQAPTRMLIRADACETPCTVTV